MFDLLFNEFRPQQNDAIAVVEFKFIRSKLLQRGERQEQKNDNRIGTVVAWLVNNISCRLAIRDFLSIEDSIPNCGARLFKPCQSRAIFVFARYTGSISSFPSYANSPMTGWPLSATVNGRNEGDIVFLSSGIPNACAMVALNSGTITMSSTTSRPSLSVIPYLIPP